MTGAVRVRTRRNTVALLTRCLGSPSPVTSSSLHGARRPGRCSGESSDSWGGCRTGALVHPLPLRNEWSGAFPVEALGGNVRIDIAEFKRREIGKSPHRSLRLHP